MVSLYSCHESSRNNLALREFHPLAHLVSMCFFKILIVCFAASKNITRITPSIDKHWKGKRMTYGELIQCKCIIQVITYYGKCLPGQGYNYRYEQSVTDTVSFMAILIPLNFINSGYF